MSNLSDLYPPRLGPSGSSGASAHSGTSAYSGGPGGAGTSGSSGASGASGYAGKSGYSGLSGSYGTSGYSGTTGTSAYSGVAGGASTTDNLDVTVTAGEALSARDFVYVAPVTGGGLTAGRAYKADADTGRASTQGFYFGFVVANISAAATGTVRLMGSMAGFTVTAGAPQYLSTTAGAITETAPSNSLMVGIALDSSTVLINSFGSNAGIDSSVPPGYKGYFTGGGLTGFPYYSAVTDLLTFSTDTNSTATTANLANARTAPAGIAKQVTSMYISGGYTANPVPPTSIVTTEKITFSSDVSSTVTTANISQARLTLHAISEGTSKGYFTGGYTGAGVSVVTADKLTYATESTAASTASNLSQARDGASGVSQAGTKGYFCGGQTAVGSFVNTADKVTYSSDATAAATTAKLSAARTETSGISEGSSKGYFTGGYITPDMQTTGDKVTFSTDTTAAVTTANLSSANYAMGSVSEGSNKGYCSAKALADKITFSTDTSASCSTAILTTNRYYLTGAGDSGW